MENKNICFNHTLEQYNKKYKNRNHRLLKFTKKDVEEFDRKHGHYIFNGKTYELECKNYLLKNRKWCYIKATDTYYEIPKPIRFTWFRNLNAGLQAASCILGVGFIATSVAVPTYLMTKNTTKDPEPEPVPPTPPEPVEEITYIINPDEPIPMDAWNAGQFRFGPSYPDPSAAKYPVPSNLKAGNTIEIYFTDVNDPAIDIMDGHWHERFHENIAISADLSFKFLLTEDMYNKCFGENNPKDLTLLLKGGSAKLSKMLFRTMK